MNWLEPILAQSTDVATPPPLSFSEISPADFLFLAEKGLAGGGAVALATLAAFIDSLDVAHICDALDGCDIINMG